MPKGIAGMEEQTKIGTGAAAGIALMALLEPHFFEPYPKTTILIYAILIATTLWGFWPVVVRLWRGLLKKGLRRMWPQYLMAVCGVGFFIGLIAFLQLNAGPQPKEAEKAEIPRQVAEPITKPFASVMDGMIKIDRELAAATMPADGQIIELVIGPDDATSFQTHWGYKQLFAKHPEVLPDGQWQSFKVTNFSPSPVFNLRADLHISYIDQKATNEQGNEQKLVDQRTIGMLLPQLDAGTAAAQTIFAFNLSKFLVMIDLPKEAEVQRLGTNDREKIKLIPASFSTIGLLPKP